jgi:type IV pilus assembly protein PilE
MRYRSRPEAMGFTLIELLIAVAIAAILVTVAYPSYTEYALRGHRAGAQNALTEIAGRQQQFLLDQRAYAESLTELGVVLDAEVDKRYDITVDAPGGVPPSFTLVATPKGSQAKDKCGAMSMDQASRREPAGCW